MTELRWDDFRFFASVAREGTLSAAADALEVNASTVHRRINSLEESLGATLFERDPRGYSLTPVGEALLPLVNDLQEGVMAAKRRVLGHDRQAQGQVRITMPTEFVPFIAPCLAEVQQTCPGLIPIVYADSRVLNLRDDTDIALRPSANPPQDAIGRKLSGLAFAVYASRELCGGKIQDRCESWVDYAAGSAPSKLPKPCERGEVDKRVALEVNAIDAMHHVLVAGAGRGYLPCLVGDSDERLVRMSPTFDAGVHVWLLIHSNLRRSARVRALLDALEPHLSELSTKFEGRVEARLAQGAQQHG